MNSIGDIIDKLVIENIKIFSIREKIHSGKLSDKEHVQSYNQMNGLNKNRATLMSLLDEKVERVVSGKEKNSILQVFKTY